MSSFNSAVSPNATIVRPPFFFVSGFSNIPHVKYYYIFMCFVYAVTVLGNSFIMLIIYMDRNLHTPKYVIVFHLAVVDLCSSTALIPKFIDTFLFDNQLIAFEACLANFFFVQCFTFMQSLTLILLAYDRFIAICFPLKYHVIITNVAMVVILAVLWTLSSGLVIAAVVFMTRLSFCKSIVINSYYCDYGPMFRLACNDNSPNYIISIMGITIMFVGALVLIVATYVCIIFALLKIASAEERLRAMKTCTSHLIVVALFYLPISSIYIAAIVTIVPPNVRIISTSLSYTIPPMLNPIIYTLKTEEIVQAIQKLFKRVKVIKPEVNQYQ
ncbi:olfactory receptor 51F2-like [Amia ocellicauda]|uniref:olfactory receptor 51F2-like n=1 Tax=Amia ocellicauda TaxID=2972642 RepID=UPI003464C053